MGTETQAGVMLNLVLPRTLHSHRSSIAAAAVGIHFFLFLRFCCCGGCLVFCASSVV